MRIYCSSTPVCTGTSWLLKVVLPIPGSKNEFLNFLRSIKLSKLVFGSQAIEFGLFAKYFTNKLLAQIQFLVVQS